MIAYTGSRILGRAFVEAGRQAIRNARAAPIEAAAGGATTGAGAVGLNQTHRMTLDEARMILNLKNDVSVEAIERAGGVQDAVREEMIKHYERLFEINAPPAPKGKTGGGQGSFYIQSKVVRARERIEAEWELYKPKDAAAADEATK
ncbi:mitochondrial import inner membrane translocase subunit TIM16 [Malassezia cuniculi]|uniref:Mitochondrial import inner membrane translocase subunit TIM16 n=1 Tax=Malassezia cuniculi TaxID=948313 RepID=A0AAF0ESL7_9BASI|nr:mitochondrial import inner membrane translocase subunit TIM16 [Malassezia cuniculi]